MFSPSDLRCILDKGQVTRYFCWISEVVYLVYDYDPNAGPESQAILPLVKVGALNKVLFYK